MNKLRRNKKLRHPHKKRSIFRPRGYIADIIIIVLVLIFSFFLVGDLFPKFQSSQKLDFYQIDPSDVPTWSYKNLQLKTFGFKKCSGTIAMDFLIDQSGSMSFGTKLRNLQTALRFFGQNFPDTGVVAMQTYKTNATDTQRFINAVVPFGYWQDQKAQFNAAVNAFSPMGATYSRDAMSFVKQQIDANRANFPRYKFALVFISDGIPETGPGNIACSGGVNGPNCSTSPQGTCRCFDPSQDPTSVAQEIKDSGVRIFTIRYLDDYDAKFNAKLTTMMDNVASSVADSFVAPINNQLIDIMQKITTRACTELNSPGL